MTFKICSYILKPNVKRISIDDPDLKNSFLAINELKNHPDYKKKLNFRALEGYIHIISEEGDEIMNERDWDSITDLWAYILNALEEFIIKGKAEFYFPAQPTKIIIEEVNPSNVLFKIDGNKERIFSKESFVKALLDAAEAYYQSIGSFFMTGNFVAEESQIKRLNQTL